MQVLYCNGSNEHYIDLACPFGKTNSTLEFCPPVKLFAMSAAFRWNEVRKSIRPRLSSYVDDIYGGIPDCDKYKEALEFRGYICDKGAQMTFIFNQKEHKTPLPARKQVILGCLFDSTTRRMRSSEKKVRKYVSRIEEALSCNVVEVSRIMSLHGNLAFAANVAPFGKPFLATLSNLISGRDKKQKVRLTALVRLSLRV